MGRKKDYHECLTTPFETGIQNFPSVAKYFMYYAPNIDSAQSNGKILGERADSLMDAMLKVSVKPPHNLRSNAVA